MNKVVCTFKNGPSLTFTTDDRRTALRWLESLRKVEDLIKVTLVAEEKPEYRQAV